MKHLRKHWHLTALAIVLLVGGGMLWWQSTIGRAALLQEPPTYTPITQLERDGVRTVMEQIHLDRDALIALNPTASQAESILGTIRTWHEANTATLASLKLDVDRGRSAVRKAERAIRVGPADAANDGRLANARRDFGSAKMAQADGFAALETSIESLLSPSQVATWSAIKTGHGRSMPVCMLDLTDQQRMDLSRADRTYRRQRAGASTASERDVAVTARNTSHQAILTGDQQTLVEDYYAYYASASEAVASAIDAVLKIEGDG